MYDPVLSWTNHGAIARLWTEDSPNYDRVVSPGNVEAYIFNRVDGAVEIEVFLSQFDVDGHRQCKKNIELANLATGKICKRFSAESHSIGIVDSS